MKTEIVIIIKKPGGQPKAHLLGTVKTKHYAWKKIRRKRMVKCHCLT